MQEPQGLKPERADTRGQARPHRGGHNAKPNRNHSGGKPGHRHEGAPARSGDAKPAQARPSFKGPSRGGSSAAKPAGRTGVWSNR